MTPNCEFFVARSTQTSLVLGQQKNACLWFYGGAEQKKEMHIQEVSSLRPFGGAQFNTVTNYETFSTLNN